MNLKKLIIILNIISMILFTGCNKSNLSYDDSDIKVKGLSLKISLIQTAYEIYNVNIADPNYFNESLYKETSKEAYNHYKWIKKTYSSMDDNMKVALENIFNYKSDWSYIDSVINLDDYSSVSNIIKTINADEYLNLSDSLKKDVEDFLTYFADNYFLAYFKKNENKYSKKANNLNDKLYSNEVDALNFVQTSSGVNLNEDYTSVMYYNLNPIESRSFEHENMMISTISSDTTTLDVLSIPFYRYSRPLFDTFTNSSEFINICEKLKNDKDILNAYESFNIDSFSFNDFCCEVLISGFSKYLDYKYYGSSYEYSNYIYDVDFYNYLKDTGFNPNKISLKDVSINFYNHILNS